VFQEAPAAKAAAAKAEAQIRKAEAQVRLPSYAASRQRVQLLFTKPQAGRASSPPAIQPFSRTLGATHAAASLLAGKAESDEQEDEQEERKRPATHEVSH
jgi:hypothetical protein